MSLKKIKPITLFSERLTLRSYQQDDETILFHHYFGSVEASKYLQRAPHQNIAQTQQSLKLWAKEKWQNSDPEFMWIIADRFTQKPMGILIFMQQHDIGEIHFGIGFAFQRQGFMQEAIFTALYFFKQNKQLKKIETFSAVENIGSRQVLEKTGFQTIQYLPKHALFPNRSSQYQDCILYQLQL